MTEGRTRNDRRHMANRVLDSLRVRTRALAVRFLAHGIPFQRLARGRQEPGLQPVIVCLWNRPERLDSVISIMEAQIGGPRIRLILWNNRFAHASRYRKRLRSWTPDGALARIELIQSPINVGGIARFLVMRDLRRDGFVGSAITFDDDQDVSPQFIAQLHARSGTHVVAGVWAFRHAGGYWTREELDDGDDADYVGTGGAIMDSEIVETPGFFTAIPRRYLFLEDMWASATARRNGWHVTKASIPFTFVLEERNQYHDMMLLKEEFYIYLAHQAQASADPVS